jgi:arylsulfatase A-like enzyme
MEGCCVAPVSTVSFVEGVDKFDKGWGAYRQEVFEHQKKLGVIPANAILPDRNPKIKTWDKLTPDEQKRYARFFLDQTSYPNLTPIQH